MQLQALQLQGVPLGTSSLASPADVIAASIHLTSCPRPANFSSAGNVQRAELTTTPQWARSSRSRGSFAHGRQYERRVQQQFSSQFPHNYIRSPWIRFQSRGSSIRWCQPDGLLIDIELGKILIIEIKLTHTPNAYWSLEHLYKPVVERLFPKSLWSIRTLEVVRSFDTSMGFPVPVVLVRGLSEVLVSAAGPSSPLPVLLNRI